MASRILSFSIKGLNGKFDVTLPFVENRIIVVGANGLGKSTSINAFYYLLSRQWTRLVELDFESVQLVSSVGTLDLKKADIERSMMEEGRGIPEGILRRARSLDEKVLTAFVRASLPELGRFRDSLPYPISILRDIQAILRSEVETNEPVATASKQLRQLVAQDQILYLPTYRRIEKDFQALVDREGARRHRGEPAIQKLGSRTDVYVEFGMEDVQERLSQTLSALNDNNRKEFNALAGSYLRDVIKGEGRSYSPDEIARLSSEEIAKILRRVEENTLGYEEKTLLREAIDRLRNGTPQESDAYVAHFLTKLVHSAENLAFREQDITGFIRTCNSYLAGKKLVYDELTYRVVIREDQKGERELDLQSLSSGEKQVVSLFAHLYLSDRRYLIVIDEPELSLSVTWQKTLLPDIWASGKCSYLAAVTHSPFIFDNDFEKYTFDMKDGIRRDG